jgi:hypothetical protein
MSQHRLTSALQRTGVRDSQNGFQLDASTIPFSHLPFGRLWYGEPNAISYAKFFSRLHHAAFSKKTGSTPGASKTSGDFADPLPSVAAP